MWSNLQLLLNKLTNKVKPFHVTLYFNTSQELCNYPIKKTDIETWTIKICERRPVIDQSLTCIFSKLILLLFLLKLWASNCLLLLHLRLRPSFASNTAQKMRFSVYKNKFYKKWEISVSCGFGHIYWRDP